MDQLNESLTLAQKDHLSYPKSKSIYSFEEVLEHAKKYFDEDELAATVWANKYALKDSTGNFYEKS